MQGNPGKGDFVSEIITQVCRIIMQSNGCSELIGSVGKGRGVQRTVGMSPLGGGDRGVMMEIPGRSKKCGLSVGSPCEFGSGMLRDQ